MFEGVTTALPIEAGHNANLQINFAITEGTLIRILYRITWTLVAFKNLVINKVE